MTFASVGIGFLLAVAAGGNAQAASAGVGPIALLFLLLGGFYINSSTIPAWISWVSKIEYVRFVYEGLAINEFNGGVVLANGAHTAPDGSCPSPPNFKLCEEGTAVLSGLFNNGEPRSESEWTAQMWKYLLFILISMLAFNTLGYIVLLMKGPKYLKMVRPS